MCTLLSIWNFPLDLLLLLLLWLLLYLGELVTVDYYGPLPEGRAKVSYIFVVIDSFAKYVKIYPLRPAQAKISAQKLILDFKKIIPVKTVLSDNGTQFTSHHWKQYL